MAVITTNGFDYIDQDYFDYTSTNNSSNINIDLPDLPSNSYASYELDIYLSARYTSYSTCTIYMSVEDSSYNDMVKNYFVLRRASTAAYNSGQDSAVYYSTTGGTTNDVPIMYPDVLDDTSNPSDHALIQMRITNDDTAPCLIMFDTLGDEFAFNGTQFFKHGSVRAQGSSGYTHIKRLSFYPSQAKWGEFAYSITGIKGT